MNFKRFDTSDNQWHDIPYYTHKTATDTLTTLPAVLYPNDTSITVGVKGQSSQSGTPSPSNPVSVDGVGELETSGEHTGQYKIPILINGNTTNIYIGDNPLRKSLDGTAYDTLDSDGTLTRRVDSDGSVLATPVVTQITMPTFTVTAGANTFDVDTTVQPSEVTATFEGWHPVQSVHEYGGAGNNIFDFANPNIANGYIADDEYCPYPTNAMIYVPIVQGIKYVASGIKRYNQDLPIRWATLNVANPNTKTAVMRTGQFNQTEKFTLTAESGETYIYFMFCGDSDYTAYGSVQNAYNANCPDVIVAEQEWE